jgi:hypothetical protein
MCDVLLPPGVNPAAPIIMKLLTFHFTHTVLFVCFLGPTRVVSVMTTDLVLCEGGTCFVCGIDVNIDIEMSGRFVLLKIAASVFLWLACWPKRSDAFPRRGSKTVCPMSQICGMLKNPAIYVEVGIAGLGTFN